MMRATIVALLCLLLAGCGPNVVNVKNLQTLPDPVVTPINARVGVFYSEDFKAYTYREKRDVAIGGEWIISLGGTQHTVFNSIFNGVFAETRELESLDADTTGLDAVIVPSVVDFQFALPTDNRVNIFEIWVKYQLSVRDRGGEEIGTWPFTAYGKTPTAMLTSSEQAIHAAALIAMRDAGASMISGLERDRRLREWLGVSSRPPLARRPAPAPAGETL